MHKCYLFLLVLATIFLCACHPESKDEPEQETELPEDTKEGMLSGSFSVGENSVVHFSKGNLEYNGVWSFCYAQYGSGSRFGWGTGDNPENNSTNYENYKTFSDWGYNEISNGGLQKCLWFTMSPENVHYIFCEREGAYKLFGYCNINGVKGIIIFPDDWSLPNGVTFEKIPMYYDKKYSKQYGKYFGYYYISDDKDLFSTNSYTIEQWSLLETAGAVFLPAINGEGIYWERGATSWEKGCCLYFTSKGLYPVHDEMRYYRGLVRLVRY